MMVQEALNIVRSTTVSHASAGEIRIVVPARLIERGTTLRSSNSLIIVAGDGPLPSCFGSGGECRVRVDFVL